MKAIYALYDHPNAAQRAVNSLRAAGVPDTAITIQSSEPFEHHEFGQQNSQTWMWWIAVGGGGLGFIIGALLTTLTQLAWPLNTGGMPIVPIWANIIPIFELTFLGVILSTIITAVVAARLFRKPPALYDPEVSNGRILIGVAHPSDARLDALEGALRSADGELKRIP